LKVLLLDTQLVLWMVLAPERLSRAARRLIEARSQPLAFSDVTLWEVSLKTSLGRPGFDVDARQLQTALLAEGLEEMAIKPLHLFALAHLPWVHRDPFDRMLIAQAQTEGIVLMTADATLKRYGHAVRKV